MAAKKYFQNRVILLLISINVFLALLVTVLIFLRMDTSSTEQIIQYRSNLGLNAFKTGSVYDILSFAVFSVGITAFNLFLSYRVFHIRQHFSIMILGLGVLLLTLALIISNALIIL